MAPVIAERHPICRTITDDGVRRMLTVVEKSGSDRERRTAPDPLQGAPLLTSVKKEAS